MIGKKQISDDYIRRHLNLAPLLFGCCISVRHSIKPELLGSGSGQNDEENSQSFPVLTDREVNGEVSEKLKKHSSTLAETVLWTQKSALELLPAGVA